MNVETKGWSNVVWSSDAEGLIRDINAELEPETWDTRFGVLQIRERRSRFNWSFDWNPRSANLAAGRVVKFSFIRNSSLLFNVSNVDFLPPDIKLILINERLGGNVV